MSVSHSQNVIQGINEGSSVSDIISALRYSFQEKEYDEAERLMVFREKKLQTEVNNLKKDLKYLEEVCNLLKESYSRAAWEKLQAVEELLDCKFYLKEYIEQLNKLNVTREELHDAASLADIRYERVADELKIVKSEREAKVAKMIEELAMRDEELKKMKEEKETAQGEMIELLAKKDEELKKVKEDKESILGEMAEKLAKKDGEINQSRTEKKNELEDLVAKVRFSQEDNTKECGVERDHCQKTPLDTSQSVIMLGEFGDQNFPRSDTSRNAHGAVNHNLPLEGEQPNGETVFATAQSRSHQSVGGMCEGKNSPAAAAPSTNAPVDNNPLPPLEIIEISDGEDESPVAEGISNIRAKVVNTSGNKTQFTPLMKHETSMICMSDSDDSSFSQLLGGKQHDADREMQDTDQSKAGNNWFENFMKAELAKIQKKK